MAEEEQPAPAQMEQRLRMKFIEIGLTQLQCTRLQNEGILNLDVFRRVQFDDLVEVFKTPAQIKLNLMQKTSLRAFHTWTTECTGAYTNLDQLDLDAYNDLTRRETEVRLARKRSAEDRLP